MSVAELDPHAENRATVVAALRDLLERAEAGEFRSVHVSCFRIEDNAMTTVSAGDISSWEVLAQFEVHKHRMLCDSD